MSNPNFQRRHYEAIAATLRLLGDNRAHLPAAENAALAQTRDVFADMLAADNPRFDRARFLKACDVGED